VDVLRILHLSHGSLPDWRIEKSALSGRKNGHDVFFAGERPREGYASFAFSKLLEVDWMVGFRVDRVSAGMVGIQPYWNQIKKQVQRVVDEVRPDVIHAHDIYPGKMALELGLPFVYDDHEYWSKHSSLVRTDGSFSIKNFTKKLGGRYAGKIFSAWEREIVSSAPVITVSDAIIRDFGEQYGSNRLFLVPNYPTLHEVSGLPRPRQHPQMTSVYAGTDDMSRLTPHRNVQGFPELFESNDIGNLVMVGPKGQSSQNVRYTGFVNRGEMYSEMANGSVGILPWQSHWFHKYSNPNKAYEYAHAGLFVMCTSSFESVAGTLKENCTAFDDYASLTLQLSAMKNDMDELYNKRLKIFEFARSKLVWENNERNILAAYQAC
jgi:glycosyltransferase involved in cell wall biosynthesis